MQAHLRQVILNPLTIIGIACFLSLILFNEKTSMYYYLTIAQLVYIPVVVCRIVKLNKLQTGGIILGQLAVTSLYFFQNETFVLVASSIYVMSTLLIGSMGLQRFLQRGFTNTAEVMIDIGLIYIVMGGGWFFAHINGIETGFSPIITWLTSIHFHYSACLLCITVGLLGRKWSGQYFTLCCSIIAAGPMLVAIGITFSRVVEIISVSLYVVAIFSLTVVTWRIRFSQGATIFIRLAFLTLCFTIVWSFLYAYSNLKGINFVGIPDMLVFHGVLNCIVFGGAIVIGWSLYTPASTQQPYTFPISQLRGEVLGKQEAHHALVDDMSVFINKQRVTFKIYDFYENTSRYSLIASVKWNWWFKPFAFIYQFISRKMGQLNLPFSSNQFAMQGTITKIDHTLDGRDNPRVWQRSQGNETIFSAIYSIHTDDFRAYMNIALPLPKSTMHGILVIEEKGDKLYLTSNADGDTGTYLSFANFIIKLPLHEYFTIWEENGELRAVHIMKLFGVKFLQIDYWIN